MNKSNFLKFILLFMICWMGNNSLTAQTAVKTIIIDPGHGGSDGGASGRGNREADLALAISLKLRDVLKASDPNLKLLMTRETNVLPGNQTTKNAALRWRADFANRNNGDIFVSIHLNASPGNQKYGSRQVGTRQQTYYVYQGKGKARKKIKKTKTVPVYEKYRLEPKVKGTQTYILARDWYNQKLNSVGEKEELYETGENDSLDAEMLQMDPVEARIRAAQYTKYFFQKSLTLGTYVEEEFAKIGRYSWGVLQRNWAGIWVLQATQMPSILVETGFIDHWDEEDYLESAAGQSEMANAIAIAILRYKQLLEGTGAKEAITQKQTPEPGD